MSRNARMVSVSRTTSVSISPETSLQNRHSSLMELTLTSRHSEDPDETGV
jgi:hypothetical protein